VKDVTLVVSAVVHFTTPINPPFVLAI